MWRNENMKMKYLFMIVLLFGFTYTGYSQVDEKSVCGKWQLQKARHGDNSGYVDTVFTYKEYLIFTPDHKCQSPAAFSGNAMKGTWQLNDSIITITLINDRVIAMKVTKVTSDALEFTGGNGNYFFILTVRREQE